MSIPTTLYRPTRTNITDWWLLIMKTYRNKENDIGEMLLGDQNVHLVF